MRVISGKFKGMNLVPFKGEEIRPTADRVKESLFNILSPNIAGARALDLFCGSGSLGIECLSRGAKSVHFNDISKDSLAVLKKNLSRIRDCSYIVTNYDYALCLSKTDKFDLIFIDPPYASEAGVRALELIAGGHMAEGGVAVYERDRSFEGEVQGLEKFDERKYGKIYLAFFRPSSK